MYSDFLQQSIIDGDVSKVESTLNSGYNINQTDGTYNELNIDI